MGGDSMLEEKPKETKMSLQSLYAEFGNVATIENIDGTIMVSCGNHYAVGMEERNGDLVFVTGKSVTSKTLHEMILDSSCFE
jgi:hypothetical protein